MCEKGVGTYTYICYSVFLIAMKLKKCVKKKSVSKESFVLKLYLIKYQSHKMCEEVVNAHLPLLKFVHDWFVTNKMLKNLDNVVFF